jgi:hypothetical protein
VRFVSAKRVVLLGDAEQGESPDNLLVDAGRDSQPLVNGERQYPCGSA